MKSLFVLIVLLTCSVNIFTQQDPGAKQIALSNSDIAVSDDVFALFYNPAGLAQIDHREVGVFYSPSPFGMAELKNIFAAYSEPMSFGALAIGAMTYGFELYRENKITFGVSYNYQQKIYLGAAANYKNISIKNYGNKNAMIFDLGIIAVLTEELHFGFSYRNIARSSLSSDNDELPVIFQSGLSYKIINNCTLSFAVEKDIRYKASPRFGIDYRIIKYLSLRSGFAKEPNTYSLGIGIHYLYFNFNYAMFTHQELGITHQVGIIISFKKN